MSRIFLSPWYACREDERRFSLIFIIIVFVFSFIVCFKRQERLQAMKALTHILYLLHRLNKRR